MKSLEKIPNGLWIVLGYIKDYRWTHIDHYTPNIQNQGDEEVDVPVAVDDNELDKKGFWSYSGRNNSKCVVPHDGCDEVVLWAALHTTGGGLQSASCHIHIHSITSMTEANLRNSSCEDQYHGQQLVTWRSGASPRLSALIVTNTN